MFGCEHVPGEIETRQPVALKNSLIREVVNREHGRCVAELWVRGVARLEIDGDEAGLPIVSVDEPASRALTCRELECRPRQDAIPSWTVRIVLRSDAVNAIPIVELRSIHEDRSTAAGDWLFEQPEIDATSADHQRKPIDHFAG